MKYNQQHNKKLKMKNRRLIIWSTGKKGRQTIGWTDRLYSYERILKYESLTNANIR